MDFDNNEETIIMTDDLQISDLPSFARICLNIILLDENKVSGLTNTR
jgi:hypothetical protein